jgi:hypothetical protein
MDRVGRLSKIVNESYTKGKIAVVLSNGQLSIRRLDETKTVRSTGLHANARELMFSPDLAHIVSIDDVQIDLWDSKTLDRVSSWHKHTKPVFSLSSEFMVTASKEDFTIQLWNLRERTSRSLRGHSSPITTMSFSSDSTSLRTASERGAVIIWGLTTETRDVYTVPEHRYARFASHSKELALVSGTGWYHYDLSQPLSVWMRFFNNAMDYVAVSPDLSVLAGKTTDNSLEIISKYGNNVIENQFDYQMHGQFFSIEFSNNSKCMVLVFDIGFRYFWISNHHVNRHMYEWSRFAGFSPDSRVFAYVTGARVIGVKHVQDAIRDGFVSSFEGAVFAYGFLDNRYSAPLKRHDISPITRLPPEILMGIADILAPASPELFRTKNPYDVAGDPGCLAHFRDRTEDLRNLCLASRTFRGIFQAALYEHIRLKRSWSGRSLAATLWGRPDLADHITTLILQPENLDAEVVDALALSCKSIRSLRIVTDLERGRIQKAVKCLQDFQKSDSLKKIQSLSFAFRPRLFSNDSWADSLMLPLASYSNIQHLSIENTALGEREDAHLLDFMSLPRSITTLNLGFWPISYARWIINNAEQFPNLFKVQFEGFSPGYPTKQEMDAMENRYREEGIALIQRRVSM